MTMLDWNDYRNQILPRVGEIGKLSPDTVKGYAASSGAGAKTGHLDAKTRELIALLTRSKRQPETGHSIAWVPVEAADKVSATAHRLQRPSCWPLKKKACGRVNGLGSQSCGRWKRPGQSFSRRKLATHYNITL